MRLLKLIIICLITTSSVVAQPSQGLQAEFISNFFSTDYPFPFLQKAFAPVSSQMPSEKLMSGQAQKLTIECQTSQTFYLNLAAGQLAQLRILKGDLNLRVKIFSPREILIADLINTRFEDMHLEWISETDGKYTLQVISLERNLTRDYTIDNLLTRQVKFADYENVKYNQFFADGEKLFAAGKLPDFKLALEKYQSAFEGWQQSNSYLKAARSAARIGEIYLIWGDNQKAFSYFNMSFGLSLKDSDQTSRLTFLNLMTRSRIYLGKMTEARQSSEKVIASSQKQFASIERRKFLKEEGWAIMNIGEILYSEGDLRGSLDNFTRSRQIFTEINDRYGEAFSDLLSGYAYSDLGYLDDARNCYQSALNLFEQIFNVKGKALILTALGGNYSFRGDQYQALAFHNKALLLFQQIGDSQFEGVTLNGIAKAYGELNELDLAYSFYYQAAALFQKNKNTDFESTTLLSWGQNCQASGKKDEALANYKRGFELSKALGKKRVAAYALMFIASIFDSPENPEPAVPKLKKSLVILKSIRDRRGQGQVFNKIGDIYYKVGNYASALKFYRQALAINQAIEDKKQEAQTLYNIALTARATGELDASLENIMQAVQIMEKLRVMIANQILRMSYFSTAAEYYDFYINLLMQLNKMRPGQGYEIRAWQASEKVKSRVLLESLSAAKIKAERIQNVDLRIQEEKLTQAINEKINFHSNLITRDIPINDINKSIRELRQLFINYEELQERIKKEDSSQADLMLPETVAPQTVKTILQKDPETLLMEYLLTDEKGYLWTIDGNDIRSYELPSRIEIDKSSREFYEVLTARQRLDNETAAIYQQRYIEAENKLNSKACQLSRMLIPRDVLKSDKKRLLIVPDKILNHVPFDALSSSCWMNSVNNDSEAVYNPLLAKFETAVISSASALSILRKRNINRAAAPNFAAILADPVFEANDSRIKLKQQKLSSVGNNSDTSKDANIAVRKEISLRRLRASLTEAERVVSLNPTVKILVLGGFEANLTESRNPRLRDYQIIHFATHSLADDKIPEISGIYLSRFNSKGESLDGVLRLADIYNLDINAELIVLSGCDSAIGQNVAGEGLISLSRGFISAGAKSVVGSLWKVDDQATAELINHFYTSIIDDKVSVSEALRKAKIKMITQKKWQSPFFWSGFVLQGEFNTKIVVDHKRYSSISLISLALLSIAAVISGIKLMKILRRK